MGITGIGEDCNREGACNFRYGVRLQAGRAVTDVGVCAVHFQVESALGLMIS